MIVVLEGQSLATCEKLINTFLEKVNGPVQSQWTFHVLNAYRLISQPLPDGSARTPVNRFVVHVVDSEIPAMEQALRETKIRATIEY